MHVLQASSSRSLASAGAEAMSIVNAYAEALISIEPALLAQGEAHRSDLARYLAALCQWQRGNIESSLDGTRYRGRGSLFEALEARA